MSNVLILAAHPDDETLGMGATISKLLRNGNNLLMMTFTDGGSSRDGSRAGQLITAAQIYTNFHYKGHLKTDDSANFPDNAMDTVSLLNVCKHIEHCLGNFNPDIIFTHHRNCLNIDHRTVYNATLTVFRPQGKVQNIYSYFINSSTDYNPHANFLTNYYSVVNDEDVNIKLNVLNTAYHDEMRKHPHSRSIENIKAQLTVIGAEIGVKYAEKFEVVRIIDD